MPPELRQKADTALLTWSVVPALQRLRRKRLTRRAGRPGQRGSLERVSPEALMAFFRELRECPECGSDPQVLAEIEENVWREFLRGGER